MHSFFRYLCVAELCAFGPIDDDKDNTIRVGDECFGHKGKRWTCYGLYCLGKEVGAFFVLCCALF